MKDEAEFAADVDRDLRMAAWPSELADVRRAYRAAMEALEAGEPERAAAALRPAARAAPESAAIHEALGLALYHAEEFSAAAEELGRYRELSGRQDQNHVLADCARALGRHADVRAYVQAMQEAEVPVPAERVAEGLIVLASDHADRGQLREALSVLTRAELAPDEVEPHHVRLWYVAAGVAEGLGDEEAAREYLEAIAAVVEDYFDVEERLAAFEADAEPGSGPTQE